MYTSIYIEIYGDIVAIRAARLYHEVEYTG